MKTFTIDNEGNISVFTTAEEAAAATTTPFDSFASSRNSRTWPQVGRPSDLVATWNSLSGVTPVKKFKDPRTAISRIWARVQGLGESAEPAPEPAAKSKVAQKASGRARAAKGAPVKGKASKKATPAKAAPKAKKAAKVEDVSKPRGGSKMAEVIAMLQRAKGATITEAMRAARQAARQRRLSGRRHDQ